MLLINLKESKKPYSTTGYNHKSSMENFKILLNSEGAPPNQC